MPNKYVKEINSGEREKKCPNHQGTKRQETAREVNEGETKSGNGSSRKGAGNGQADSVTRAQKLPEAAASKRPPQASPRQSRQMQKLGFPQHKRRKKHKVNKAKKKQIIEELQDLNFIDEFDDDKDQRFEPAVLPLR